MDEEEEQNENPKFGEKIKGLNPKVEESSSEEEDENGKPIPKKKKITPPFNVASLIGVDSKRQKILNIRKLRGDIIGASTPTQ